LIQGELEAGLEKGPDDEAQAAHRRADYCHPEGARGRHEDGRPCREHGISQAFFYNWEAKYGGVEVSEAKRLKGAGERERQAEEAAG
jgi:hypothetical protein